MSLSSAICMGPPPRDCRTHPAEVSAFFPPLSNSESLVSFRAPPGSAFTAHVSPAGPRTTAEAQVFGTRPRSLEPTSCLREAFLSGVSEVFITQSRSWFPHPEVCVRAVPYFPAAPVLCRVHSRVAFHPFTQSADRHWGNFLFPDSYFTFSSLSSSEQLCAILTLS